MSVKKLIGQLKEKKKGNQKLPELRAEEVENIIESFFENYEHKRGSHIIVQDSRLERYGEINQLSEYGRRGQLTIPVKSGQKVKSVYVKKLIEAIEICEFMEGKSEEED